RRAFKGAEADSNNFVNNGDSGNNNNNNNNNDDTNNNNNNNNNNSNNIPSEISHCTWSTDGVNGFPAQSNHLGAYSFCKSSDTNNPNDVYIQVQQPVSDAQVCIIPTSSSGSNSIYIGEPRCLMITEPQKIYKVTLLKNRPGFSTFPLSGAMIMKDKAYFYPPPFYQYVLSPDAYIFCSQFLDQYGDPSYCVSFKSVSQYIYHQF
ncbi:MAG: hypothetical protein HN509_08095, partial [Halobacteriovoraceae bacterium]|nr:hypothetical protein [Halobacteriovoraceae bacterium]